MSLRFLSLLIPISFLSACTSYRLQISAVSEETYWRQGRECVGLADNQVEVHLFPEKATAGQMIWYLEITNLSDKRLEVLPSGFYYEYSKGPADTITGRRYARNPEGEIERIEKAKKREDDAHLVSSSADMLCCCLNFLGGVAHMVEGEHEAAEESRERSDEALERLIEEQEEHEARVDELEIEQEYRQETVLRRTTLMKEETIGGLVQFPMVKMAKRIILTLPIETSLLQFEYTIDWIEY